ncbi:hypothetical protein GTW51_22120 [Aurantimonas aggregata]|uniref:Uncharacterized protein n=1 Tax=Aurantimonas aggregata TaxID=2047720 RepID=A0A6L9MPA0_9HYPH|nr:hypothetical protein [Aurantimonas aggregata]NDV89360.1 hypothetical protein [Aurantimonas aggregata]
MGSVSARRPKRSASSITFRVPGSSGKRVGHQVHARSEPPPHAGGNRLRDPSLNTISPAPGYPALHGCESASLADPIRYNWIKSLTRRSASRHHPIHSLSLPTAQACIDAVHCAGYHSFKVLTPEQIASGSETRHKAVYDGGFETHTPLWFYVLKEAEVLGDGEHLGPLGIHLVANTLVGLIVNDLESYWNAHGGRWKLEDFNASRPMKSIEDVARFCGVF